jgi:DNA repair exonuclease SbcCD ATPase subunit
MSDRDNYRFRMGGDRTEKPIDPKPPEKAETVSAAAPDAAPPTAAPPPPSRAMGIAVVLTLIFAAALAWIYFDTNRRLAGFENAGASDYQNLSRDLQSRFSNLTIRQAKLEETQAGFAKRFDKELPAMTKKIDDAASRLTKAAKSVDANTKSLKTVESGLATHEKALGTLRDDMATLGQRTDAQEKSSQAAAEALSQLQAENNRQWAEVQRRLADLDALESRIQELSAAQISKRELDLALLDAKVAYQESLRSLRRELDRAMAGIDKRLTSLEKRRNRPPSAAATPAPAAATSEKPDGQIVEQEIKK